MHPFKHHADKSNKDKMGGMHKGGVSTIKNIDLQGSYKHVDRSSDHMQHEKQAGAAGMAKGGRLDHAKRGSKHKSPIARGAIQAPPSPEDMAAMQGAAGASPPPAAPPSPMPGMPPGMPPQKRGGAVHKARGGSVKMDAGACTGEGRIEKIKAYGLKPIKGKGE